MGPDHRISHFFIHFFYNSYEKGGGLDEPLLVMLIALKIIIGLLYNILELEIFLTPPNLKMAEPAL